MARTIQRLTPAARRFYRAFYQWNVVQDAGAGALPHSATTACSRRIATSSYRGQEKRTDRERSKWKSNPSVRTAAPGGAVEWRPMHNQPNPDQDEIRSIRTWLDFPVKTSSQWPSAGLQAWQQAVRYRGDDGLVVEVALPSDQVERIKQAYGPSLERLTKGTGATIELRTVQGGEMSLALVKTPLIHADRLKTVLWTFKLDQPYTSVASTLDREKIKRNKGPAPKGWNEYERSMWNRFELKAPADRPPSQMLPWEMVFRARDVHTKRGRLDMAIPESWFQYMHHEGRDATVFLRSVFGDVYIPKFPIKSARDGSEVHDVRNCSLRGDMAALHAATTYLGTLKNFENSLPTTTAHGHSGSPVTINKDPTNQTGTSILVPSALTTFVTDKAFREAVKRLTGLENFDRKIHPVDDDHVSISVRGLREPCRLAAQLVRWRIRFAYLHLFRFGALGDSGAIAPPPDRFIPAHEAQPQPQFYAKLIFVPDLHPKLTEDFARQWIQDDEMLKLSLETSCKIALIDRGRDGWIVEGPEPGLERVKAVFQQRLDQAGEDLRVWEIERCEVQRHRADPDAPTWLPSMANLECLQMHERSSAYLQHLAQCSEIVSYHPAPQPNAPLLNGEFIEDDASSSPESTPNQHQTLPEDMRAILRPLTHPVVLITARDAVHSTADQSSFIGCRGVTVSSFTAVTLFPQPIVSFNLKVPSRTWDAIASSQWLTAHILSANADAATLTHAFTQPYPSPEHAFHVIRKLGVQISLPTTEPSRSPRLNHKEAVLAQVHARILPAKCVQAGDHVIVVAEVKKVGIARREDERRPIEGGREKALARLGSEEVVGLTYAKKGYRKGAGEMIQVPDKLPDVDEVVELESATGGEVTGRSAFQEMGEEERGKKETQLSEEDDEDVFKPEEMHGREGLINGRREDVNGGARSEAMQEEDKQDLGMGASEASNTHHKDVKLGESTASQSSADEVFHSLREPDSQLQELSGNVDQLLGSARAEPRPVLGQPRQLPAFSSAERKMRSAQFKLERSAQRQPNRSFSAAATPPYEDEQGNNTTSLTPRQPKQDQAQQDPSSYVNDPTLSNQTIADLLGEPPSSSDPAQRPPGIRRIRGLLRAQEASREASHKLQSALEAGTLTPAQSLKLETTIRTNDRRVTKTLALRAANALRILLDSNSLPSPFTGEAAAAGFRRVAWMEAQIEKGQRALLEEAKEVRELFEEGKIDEEVFLQAKEKLRRVFGVLDGEVGRLREWVKEAQEEGDGGDGGWD
ncbi:hypothetical protein KC332_g6044 [Hortaea werneckii]|nr:hypothetical protein KC358_g11509 [Hortaea werneckii]KAI6916029.1 hypothetical protein KC348_g11748 [Hortaea werneckii]KAI6931660.1 hypothetical protein KC341_g9474 [Hortaea werneckii]KAI6962916.1 hypothetical protein KC321_g11499 [Hortaea werneckii]KAI6975031.1 hypothetical protein KC329_g11699 [Hortaea werneckii]